MKFQTKKPVVVEAFQMTAEARRQEAYEDWPDWLKTAWQTPFPRVGSFYPLSATLCLSTKDGGVVVAVDDWIVRDAVGKLSACKPDIFEATYESA